MHMKFRSILNAVPVKEFVKINLKTFTAFFLGVKSNPNATTGIINCDAGKTIWLYKQYANFVGL